DGGTIQGTLDAVTFAPTRTGIVVSIEGWALDSRGHLESVGAELDGTMIGSTADFFERPDVSAFFHTPAGLTGWRIRVIVESLTRGNHRVQAVAQSRQCRQPLPAKTLTY